ncbi:MULTISPECIES: alanine--tRNA ligase [Lachnospiraceae]|jgi:alanyl-tRNA synthetase|uniref:Alanine--tRNA ligase n=1 Tax=Faecalicatena acetigenes TaxID=2981790 RepID=A0ABT2TD26_9FIRM|nr:MULTISPECIES: alanine--tRNA ligase [Lachnospiraceae]MCU6748142.1 alanine--tRNA ligase [Faecalicatena acetigenes]RGT74427.1 alanine--tRNA ligase [Ruminococcus sp. AF18-22]SCI28791.1 Alanine--tRNA ligase [uncultured Clostridium sp.]
MQPYGVNQLRKMFLEFFESKGHLALKSFSLVPHNDKSLLLINSGMAPLKPYFTGQEIPPKKRVTTCQKCIRTGDIENVGKTARHGTFFEMLGNFSFGDYFKREAIHWSWEFLTDVVGLDPQRLYPSVYLEDDEAFEIWNKEMGIPAERIFKFGKEDNFWEHGSGPCGPCSEIYYDRGEKYGCGSPDCTVGCECDRYMEIWNNVFTQFDNDGNGHYSELEQKNIDTGMGLERLASVVQDVDSIFDVDTIKALRDHVCALAEEEYGKENKKDISIRVITDHIRSVTFMISDGIMPSNEGRGYVLRRLLRRACRHGRLLDIKNGFLPELAQTVIEGSKDGYPELEEKKEFILKVIAKEEEQFNKTIDQGLGILSDMITQMEKEKTEILKGDEAFKLYDTYGFPLDLTKEILEEKNLKVDEEGFHTAMEVQRKTAREAREVTNYMGADVTVYESIDPSITSTFVGYDHLSWESEVTVLTTEEEVTEALSDGERGTVFVQETPFYAASGGQEADTGTICTETGEFRVEDTIKLLGGKIGHVGIVTKGMIKTSDKVTLKVDARKRALSARNHSATHLLQKALRTVLGTHVEQAGSSVNEDRLRFDFTHFSAVKPEELKKVEQIVNEQIENALPVIVKNMPIEEARKTGAQALFGEKYGDIVRVVDMGGFSIEFCGGTHVKNTSEIMSFKIISETGVAAGVRRIEALTSNGLMEYYDRLEKKLKEAALLIKATPENLAEKITHMISENKALHAEVEGLKSKIAQSAAGDILDKVTEIGGVKLLAAKIDGVDMNGLRELGDQLKEKLGEGVVVLASGAENKVSLMATATEGAMKQGAHAGNLVKAIAGLVGGGGGGRPNMAQAGGKNPAGIEEALSKATEVLKSQVS